MPPPRSLFPLDASGTKVDLRRLADTPRCNSCTDDGDDESLSCLMHKCRHPAVGDSPVFCRHHLGFPADNTPASYIGPAGLPRAAVLLARIFAERDLVTSDYPLRFPEPHRALADVFAAEVHRQRQLNLPRLDRAIADAQTKVDRLVDTRSKLEERAGKAREALEEGVEPEAANWVAVMDNIIRDFDTKRVPKTVERRDRLVQTREDLRVILERNAN
jgi:hypothetical protein